MNFCYHKIFFFLNSSASDCVDVFSWNKQKKKHTTVVFFMLHFVVFFFCFLFFIPVCLFGESRMLLWLCFTVCGKTLPIESYFLMVKIQSKMSNILSSSMIKRNKIFWIQIMMNNNNNNKCLEHWVITNKHKNRWCKWIHLNWIELNKSLNT